jgi:hypothetical protein
MIQSNPARTPSPHRREVGVKELLKESKTLRAENEQLVRIDSNCLFNKHFRSSRDKHCNKQKRI